MPDRLLEIRSDDITHVEMQYRCIKGNLMVQDRATCECCGKKSGLDDLVENAMRLNIHCADFMLDVLRNGPTGPSPSHSLACSDCGTMFDGAFAWFPGRHWA